jgi:hypothetical protein
MASHPHRARGIKSLTRDELETFVVENHRSLLEDEATAALDNPYVTPQICQLIAQTQRLIGFYAVRLRLVAHRATPQAHSVKLVHYLHWPDLVRLSVDVRVPPPVRRAIDNQLLLRVAKLTLGEKIAAARRCSQALIRELLFDGDSRIFESLLVNQRLREDDLVMLISSDRATVEQLQTLAEDRKWSSRYAIRKALVMNPSTPRSVAARQLRFLTRRDLRDIHSRPETSVYLRRCIERLNEKAGGLRARP